jgi:hypothetical protein
MTSTVYWVQFDTGDGTLQAVWSDYTDSYIINSSTAYKTRPVSDVAAGSWLPSTVAAPLYSMIDEAVASDSDYIYVNSSGSVAEVALQSLAPPEPSSGWTLKVRVKGDSSGRSVRVKLMQGTTEIASWLQTVTDSYATYSLSISPDQKAAVTDYSALRLRFEALIISPPSTGYFQTTAAVGDVSKDYAVPTDTNLCVAFWEHADANNGSTLSTISIGGVPMTILSQIPESGTKTGVGVAILASDTFPTGSQAHVVTWSAGGARTWGGTVIFVYFKNGNVNDPYRVVATNNALSSNSSAVTLTGVVSTDRVVGFGVCRGNYPYLSGVPQYMYGNYVNGDYGTVGDDTGLSGSVVISNGNYNVSACAGIALKAK